MTQVQQGSFLLRMLWWLPFGSAPEITPQDLAKRMKAGGRRPQVVDVRTDEEWRQGHISGAVHVPLTALRGRIGRLSLDPARPVVAICLSGHRSVPAVRLLRLHGYGEAVQLAGGMMAWRRSGLPEVR
jgi:rhodanese-related sulfurtransferase